MPRYIDKDKVLSEIDTYYDYSATANDANFIGLCIARTIILSQSEKDVSPVVHAKWEIESTWEICGMTMTTSCRCSNCKHLHHWHQEESAFCPNCGAKMDER